jgi:hypothetical protein
MNLILKPFFPVLWLKSYKVREVRCLMPKIGHFFLRLRGRDVRGLVLSSSGKSLFKIEEGV